MKKKRVLIFPAGSEGALNIYDALKFNLHFELFGCSAKKNYTDFLYPEGMYVYCDERLYISHPDFGEALKELLNHLEIDYVIPTFDDVALKLAELAPELTSKVVTSPYETALIASDKRRMYQVVQGCSFAPKVFACKEEIKEYPVFVKPAIGGGSKGAKLIDSESELVEYEKYEKNYVICENLPGTELSVECFTDRYGNLRFVGARTRERIWHGITFRGENYPVSEEIRNMAIKINQLLKFCGAWFFQVKQNKEGEYKLLEFAVRQPTNCLLHAMRGVNLTALSLFDAMEMDVQVFENDFFVQQECRLQPAYHADIAYDTVYIDFDDTLTTGKNVNIDMMRLIYQFINEKKRIVLITRHEGDLYRDMHTYRIPVELFDEIIWIKDDTPKAEYILPERAIFIDNYFKERFEVKEKHGIPVFNVDAINCLLKA